MIPVHFTGGPRDGQQGKAHRSCPPCFIRAKDDAKEAGMKGIYEHAERTINGHHMYRWIRQGTRRPTLMLIVGGRP